jgi:hypothetical protein
MYIYIYTYIYIYIYVYILYIYIYIYFLVVCIVRSGSAKTLAAVGAISKNQRTDEVSARVTTSDEKENDHRKRRSSRSHERAEHYSIAWAGGVGVAAMFCA